METRCSELLNERQLARWLRVTSKWVREEAEAGRLPCVPAGRNFLFDPVAVEALLKERAQSAQAEGATN